MKISEIVLEGGWASTKTQSTVITPKVLDNVVKYLSTTLESKLNQWLNSKNIPSVKFGRPVGSGSYYKKHLEQEPDRKYGDIDIQFIIPLIPGQTHNSNKDIFYKAVKEFGDLSGEYETESGKNIVVPLGQDQYVQVDLVAIFSPFLDWNDIFMPPEGVKGVLSSSLYSALAEALNVSISDIGVQVKTSQGQIVPFSKQKNVELHTITSNPRTWAVDIAKYFGATKIDPVLVQYPGWPGESSVQNIAGSIRGIARTLDINNVLPNNLSSEDFLRRVQEIYLSKIDKVINSSKFDKAITPEAQRKAEETKQLLRSNGLAFSKLLTDTLNENLRKNMAKVGLATAVAVGAGQLAKNFPIPDLGKYLPHPPTIQVDSTPIENAKKELDPVVKFLYSLEPNAVRDTLIDQAVLHGLKGYELAQFMAQTHHETGNFRYLTEIGSWNYITKKYDIAYNRDLALELGNTRPGDGWRYRGRGFIQLTGKANYANASQELFHDNRLVTNPELASDPIVAANIALWYWGWRVQPRVNNFTNTRQVTAPINPKLKGLDQRIKLFKFYSSKKEDNKNNQGLLK